VTPLYPQKLAPISPTSGGRSVGIDRLRTQAAKFFIIINNNNYNKFAIVNEAERVEHACQQDFSSSF
jgi:hypothetical protein